MSSPVLASVYCFGPFHFFSTHLQTKSALKKKLAFMTLLLLEEPDEVIIGE